MVEGRIEFVPAPPHLAAADVHVWLEDTTYADAPAVVVAHVALRAISYAGEPGGIAFRIADVPELSASRTYTLRVLVDLDGDGRPTRGDYVAVQAISVRAAGAELRVPVRRIE